MNSRHQRHENHQNGESMNQTDLGTVDQSGVPVNLEKQNVYGTEDDCRAKVERMPDDLGSITVRGDRGAEKEGDVEPRQPQRLAAGEDDRHGEAGTERPDQHFMPTHSLGNARRMHGRHRG